MMRAKSADETQALEKLRDRLLASGELDQGREMLAAFGGVDLCLLRFLRARKLDVGKAQTALGATLTFRAANGAGGDDSALAVRRDGISDWWCGTFAGRTASGCPITYWRFRCVEADQLKTRFDDTQLKCVHKRSPPYLDFQGYY